MLIVSDGIKSESGCLSQDNKMLFESGVFLENKKTNGELVTIDGIRIYFVQEDEVEIRNRAKSSLQEVANVINKLITYVRNESPENDLESIVINNVYLELNDQSEINEDWVVSNFRELHIEALLIGFS